MKKVSNNSKRILMINDHIKFGGGGDAAFQLERLIYEKAGYEVYTFSQAENIENLQSDYDYICHVSGNNFVRKINKFTFHYGVYNKLVDIIKNIKPDLIKVHLVSKYPASVYSALSVSECPVIQILHGPNLFCSTAWGCFKKDSNLCDLGIGMKCYKNDCVSLSACILYSVMNQLTMPFVKKNVDLFLSPSIHLLNSVKKLGFENVEYFPLGIDEKFTKISCIQTPPPLTILYVGALIIQKGVQVLIDSLKYVKLRIPEARLVIAGVGELMGELKAQATRLNLDQDIIFKGFVDRSEIVALYQSAHVLAVPSIWKEQFGLVGPEALACGIPCVGSDIGGIPEWLRDGEWGFLVPPRDAHALADKLCIILRDEKLRMRFGANGREYVLKEYSTDKYIMNVMRYADRYIK